MLQNKCSIKPDKAWSIIPFPPRQMARDDVSFLGCGEDFLSIEVLEKKLLFRSSAFFGESDFVQAPVVAWAVLGSDMPG